MNIFVVSCSVKKGNMCVPVCGTNSDYSVDYHKYIVMSALYDVLPYLKLKTDGRF